MHEIINYFSTLSFLSVSRRKSSLNYYTAYDFRKQQSVTQIAVEVSCTLQGRMTAIFIKKLNSFCKVE